jgi:hypothetical protein
MCALASVVCVLFVGNSLTEANALPALVARLAPLQVDARVAGGYALEDHWNLGGVHEAIVNGHYDVVVLQQGPSSLPESRENLVEWARTFAAAIRAAGGRPALFTVWPESWRAAAFGAVVSSYRAAAEAVHGLLLPAGDAWRRVLRAHPRLPLYGPDGFHPSRLGTYAAAVTIAAGITGRPALGMPRLGLAPRTARLLQRAAAAALAAR